MSPARGSTSLARRRARRVSTILLLTLLATVGFAGRADAHAVLLSVDPPDGARLDRSPDHVQLTFNEHVSASLGGVRVVDAKAHRVDRGAVRVSGDTVAIDLAPHLPDGTYVITYRVVSADGHPVRGASLFGIGAGDVDTSVAKRLGGKGDDDRWQIVGGIGRGFAYAGTLLAAGGALFLLFAHRGGSERQVLLRVVRGAAVVGALGGLVVLPVQAALGTGQGPGSLFDHGVLRAVLDEGVGLGLGLALVALAVLAVALERHRAVAIAAAAVAAGSFAATGHTRIGDTAWLSTPADVVHLLVVAVWGGGLVLLLACLWARRRAPEPADHDTALVVARFSTMATVTVLAAGATGLALGWSEVRALHALTSTTYGQVLLVKAGLVAVIGLIGAYNHFRLVPALEQGKARAALRQLKRTLQAEVLVLVVVVGLTAALVNLTPARSSIQGGPIERIIQLGDVGSVQLVVAPAKAGFNQIHLYTFDPEGRPTELADEIELDLALPAADVGPIERTATRAGPAHAQLNGNDLALGGTWKITVRIKTDKFTEVAGTADVPIAG